MATVVWGEANEVPVSTVAELDDVLGHVRSEADVHAPLIVELFLDDGASLSIGLGQPLSVANYVPASLDPPYLQSVADSSGANELAFYYRGDYSEFPPESGIPVEEALAGLRHFLETGRLPENIKWQET